MATIYVSNAISNGYLMGSDAYTYAQSQSKSTPVLTLTRAIAVAVAGDTIIINAGTYLEASYVSISKINLTINAEIDHQTIIKSTTGTTRVLHQLTTGTGLTLGKIVLDAQNTQAGCVTQDSSNNVNDLTINGTHFINFMTNAVSSIHCVNVTMDGGWLATSTVSTNAPIVFTLKNVTAGTISIKNGTINVSASAEATNNLYCISANPTVTGCNLIVHNVGFTYGSANADMTIQGIRVSGFTTYDLADNSFTESTVQNVGVTNEGILILNSALGSAKCWLIGNTFTGADINVGGHNICIGEDLDASTNPNSISGIFVKWNKSNNRNHHIIIAWQTGAIVESNLCDTGIIGVIGKHTTNCRFNGNLIKDITTGGSLRMKASTGDVFANNTVIINDPSSIAILVSASSGVSSGGSFKNNIIYMDRASSKAVNIFNDGSSADFANNDYYGSPTFTYQANTYNTVADWITAHESSALNVDPEFVSYPTDLRVLATSPLYHVGKFVKDAVDFRGRPFNIKPTIGAYEVSSRDKALARTSKVV